MEVAQKKKVVIRLKRPIQPKKPKPLSKKEKEMAERNLRFVHFCQDIDKYQAWCDYCKEFFGESPNKRFAELMERDLKQYEVEKLLKARGIVRYRGQE